MTAEPILFVHPEYLYNQFVGCTHHYGSSSIIGHLAEHGIEAETFLTDGTWTVRQIAAALAARKPRLVGFSCYDVNYYLIRLIVRELRRLDPETVVILGGPTPTFSSRLLLDHFEEIDGCVAGDGEDVVLELLEQGIRRGHLPEVEGFFTRASNSGAQPRNLQRNINTYPSPYIAGEIPGTRAPDVGLFSSRGCYYRCTFCNFSALSNHRVRNYTTDRLLEEISRIAFDLDGRFALLPFYDDFFTVLPQRTRKVCEGILENRLHERLAFSCQTRVDSVSRETLEMLRAAGFRIISFGIESASPRVLKTIKKVRLGQHIDEPGFGPELEFLDSLRQGVALARELGFRVTGSIILGLPGETLEDARQTLEFVRSLDLDAYSHNFLNVFPGTELFDTHERYGMHLEPSATLLPFDTHPAYDVVEAGFLEENADLGHKERIGELIRRTMEARSRGRLEGSAERVIYLAKPEPGAVAEPFWDRVAERVRPDTYFVLEQSDLDPAWCRENYQRIVDRELPILEQKVVIPRPGGMDFFISNRGGWGPATRTFCDRAEQRPFAEFVRSGDGDDAAANGNARRDAGRSAGRGAGGSRNVFYTLESEEDRRLFAAVAEQIERDGIYVVPEERLAGRACVEGLCRFGLGCPLGSGEGLSEALYTDDRGHHRSLCGLDLGPGDPAATLAALRRETEARRGCGECPAGSSCSRCLNTAAVPPEEYCRLMCRGEAVGRYARLLDFLFTHAASASREGGDGEGRKVVLKSFGPQNRSTFLTYGGAVETGPEAENGNGAAGRRVQSGVVLMLYRGTPIFFAPTATGLIEVSLPLAEVAEALHAGAGRAAMSRYFADKYELSEDDAAERIDQAVSILEDYGLLEGLAEPAASAASTTSTASTLASVN